MSVIQTDFRFLELNITFIQKEVRPAIYGCDLKGKLTATAMSFQNWWPPRQREKLLKKLRIWRTIFHSEKSETPIGHTHLSETDLVGMSPHQSKQRPDN
jgi:hypothetical protein